MVAANTGREVTLRGTEAEARINDKSNSRKCWTSSPQVRLILNMLQRWTSKPQLLLSAPGTKPLESHQVIVDTVFSTVVVRSLNLKLQISKESTVCSVAWR